jgi:hypothetical protein
VQRTLSSTHCRGEIEERQIALSRPREIDKPSDSLLDPCSASGFRVDRKSKISTGNPHRIDINEDHRLIEGNASYSTRHVFPYTRERQQCLALIRDLPTVLLYESPC